MKNGLMEAMRMEYVGQTEAKNTEPSIMTDTLNRLDKAVGLLCQNVESAELRFASVCTSVNPSTIDSKEQTRFSVPLTAVLDEFIKSIENSNRRLESLLERCEL